MSRKTLLKSAVAVAALVLPAAFSGVAASAAPNAPEPPGIWTVPVSSPQQVLQLQRDGFDLAESSPRTASVVGDSHTADRLRARGLHPTRSGDVYRPVAKPPRDGETFYGGYHTVAAHEAHLDQVAKAHSDLAQVHDIGDSWLKTKGKGGHDIKAICLTKKQQGDCELGTKSKKPKFTIMAQIHAREISTGELAWKWIDFLADGYGKDNDATGILDSTEVWVIPIANPDGVDVVSSGNNEPKMQRKNVDPVGGDCGGTDTGVDVNRNANFKWQGGGQGCDEDYSGPSAASEPEEAGLEKFFTSIYPDQRGDGDTDPAPDTATGVMLTLHSYGNYIIIPWGWTNDNSPNDKAYRALGGAMAKSNGYQVGTNGETVGYPTPGATDDFTYGRLGVASMTFEVGSDGGDCGGFFPKYSCMDSEFWPKNKGAFITGAKAAGKPYAQG